LLAGLIFVILPFIAVIAVVQIRQVDMINSAGWFVSVNKEDIFTASAILVIHFGIFSIFSTYEFIVFPAYQSVINMRAILVFRAFLAERFCRYI
jgi:LytS/YehU family sensor histidine kinase